MRLLAFLAAACLAAVPVNASPSFDRAESSYPYESGSVTLNHDASLIAVLLDGHVEDESAAIADIVSLFAELEPVNERSRQGYERLWFVAVRATTDAPRLRVILDTIDTLSGVRFASPVFRYDSSIMIPKPELLIAFKRDEARHSQDLEQEFGLERLPEIPGLSTTFHFRVPASARTMLTFATDLSRRDEILFAQPNFILKLEPHATPNDPRFSNQWHHNNTGQTGGTIGADLSSIAAWDTATGSTGIVVAIIDEGVDMDHEDLAANVVGGHESTDQPSPEGVEGNALPTNGHGTSCAGIVAAVGNNSIGVAGVCWNAGILSIRIGYNDHWTESAWCAEGITWAADNGADVLSNSWGGGAASPAIQSAIQYAKTTGRSGLGCPVLFSSGNGNSGVSYPAKFAEAIAVGASSPCDERKSPSSCDGESWWGSNFGPELSIVAPGVLIDTTDIMGSDGYSSTNYLTNFNGTSSSCPNAAGCAALLLSVLPGLTADNVQSYLEQSCDDQIGPTGEDTAGFDDYMGWGRLNLASLMVLAGAPTPPEDLTCDEIGNDTSLTWTNPQSYDSIVVSRNSLELATLPGSSTSYVDVAPGIGTHTYSVRGVISGNSGIGASCVLFHSGGATDLVWHPSANGGIVDGGQGLVNALTANSTIAIEVSDLGLVADLNSFDRVWVTLGIYPNNHVLSASESTVLENYLTDGVGGGSLYLEGGDTWAYDSTTSVHLLFNVDGIADGTGDYSSVVGGGNTVCDLTGIDIDYNGENSWIDHLAPLGAAWTIQSNDSPAYDSAVYNESSSYGTIGASHEFGGFVDGAITKSDVMAAYLSCFGFSGSVAPVTGLSCTEFGEDAVLSWTNGETYSSIEVLRDSTVIATLLGTATSYTDLSAPGGSQSYEVIGYAGIGASPPTSCTVDITPNAVASVSCAVTLLTVDLGWSNSEVYDTIQIRRNGVLVATLGGGATSYSDASPISGTQTYAVRGIIGLLGSSDATCAATYVEPPAITSHPVSAAQCPDTSVLLSVTATGDSLAYQWRKNGSDIPGASSNTYSIASLVASDEGSYDVVVSNTASSETSNPATITVLEEPTISAHPASLTDCSGAAVSFTVSASGAGLGYQWRKNGSPVAGATSSTLSLTSITMGDAGNYDCIVTGTCGNATSNMASLTVLASSSIVGQPTDVTDCPGATIAFTVTATGDSLSYQWRKNTIAVPGAVSATLTLNSISAGDDGSYDCVLNGACGSITSSAATLTVLLPPTITAQPADATKCEGASVSFAVTAVGDGLSYQWRKNSSPLGGETGASLTIASVVSSDAGSYDCVISGLCGSTTSSTATLDVFDPLAITAQPTSATDCPGVSITLSVPATGDGLSYQWRKNGAAIVGASDAILSIASLTTGDAGNYDCIVTGTCASETSNAATITVFEPPAILSHPSSVADCPGSAVSFTVTASGEGIAYQWRKDGAVVSGATLSTLSLTSITVSDTGNYDCVVTGTCGSATSNVASLTVPEPPTIVAQPADLTDCPGASVAFAVSATGDGLNYQWRKDTVALPGAVSATLNLGSISAGDGGSYDCVITGGCGTVTSSMASLVVLLDPSITTQPEDAIACESTSVSFSVTAIGDGLSYQWRKNGTPLGGETGTSLSLAAVALADAGSYDCVVNGLCGSETSSAASLTVVNPLTITSQPMSATDCPGSSIMLSVTVVGEGLSYQWRKDGSSIVGAVASILSIASVTPSDAGAYDCVITGACGSETSSTATVSVLQPPMIVSQPTSVTECPGATIMLAVTATGDSLSYQWRQNGLDISGATSPSLSLSSITAPDAGNYDCVVSGSCGSATTNAALITVQMAPSITSQPNDTTGCPGTTVSFALSATGDGLLYQWRFNGSPIAGATGPTYTIISIDAADSGAYDCIITGTCGSETSAVASLSLLPSPSITAQPMSTMGCPGSTASFSVSATGSGLSYQWRKDGIALVGATSSSLALMSIAPVDAGLYDCVVTGDCGIATSSTALLIVSNPPLVTLDPFGMTECPGAAVTFTCAATGDGLTFQWQKNGAAIGGATGTTLSLPSILTGDAGDYDCLVSGTCGSVVTSPATLTVLAVPSIITQPVSQAASVSDTVVFTVAASGAAPLAFQWHFDGAPIVGATTDTLTLSGVTSTDAGGYQVVISNMCDSATSTTAILTVGTIPPVADVTCCATNDGVQVCWVSPIAYDEYTIERDGVEIATAPSGTTCHTDSGLPVGTYTYTVIGHLLTDHSAGTDCTTTVITSVSDITCEIENPTVTTPDIALAWTNPGGYDAIEIQRDDVPIATLSGSEVSFTDLGVTPGPHVYRVAGTYSGGTCVSSSDGVECSVDLPFPAHFLRGDANNDTVLNLADVVFLLTWVFQSGEDPSCFDAADVNDDGILDLADGIYALNFIFADGPTPPEPFAAVGPDPTDDSLDCASWAGG